MKLLEANIGENYEKIFNIICHWGITDENNYDTPLHIY